MVHIRDVGEVETHKSAVANTNDLDGRDTEIQ